MTRLPLPRALPLSALACALAACFATACSRSESPDPAKPATARPSPAPSPKAGAGRQDPTSAGTRLTVYSGDYDQLANAGEAAGRYTAGFALVDSTLRYQLEAGANTITLAHLPRAIDSASATLRATDGVRMDAQRFLAPPAGAEAVLAAAIGQRVSVEHTSGGARQVDNGILVSAGDGLTLALGDGRTKVIRQYDNFSLLDGERQPPAEPTLRWQVTAENAGEHKLEFSYATGGLAWRAEYLARLVTGGEEGDCKLALDGAAMVANRSGVSYRNVALTLVAGEPNRVREDAPQMVRQLAPPAPMAADAAGAVAPRRSGEYYAYPIPARTTLAEASVERVPLFPALPGIACERGYLTRPSTGTWMPSQPITSPGFNNDTGPQPVTAAVSFANTREAGLGRPLPAGRVRVFEGGDFLGESQLGHTPEGADIHLDVGVAFDLTAERERRNFRVDLGGRNMTETFAVTVRNAKDTPVNVIVDEPLPRWSDWEIVSSTVPARQRDAQHAEFDLEVPARGERVLEYTVRYRWPAGMKP
jgi:hypothetical protein